MELSDKKLKLATIKKEVSNRKLTLDQISDASLHLVQRSSTQVLYTIKLLKREKCTREKERVREREG